MLLDRGASDGNGSGSRLGVGLGLGVGVGVGIGSGVTSMTMICGVGSGGGVTTVIVTKPAPSKTNGIGERTAFAMDRIMACAHSGTATTTAGQGLTGPRWPIW